MKLLLRITPLLLLNFPIWADLLPGLETDLQLNHGGVVRTYDVLVPQSYDGSSPVPLILDMHGANRSRGQQRNLSGLDALAEFEGFIIAYPQGTLEITSTGWNSGNLCCEPALGANADDVGFLRALVEEIASEANIDQERIYATGWSNGGAMAQRLACEAADVFAAIAPTSAPWSIDPPSACTPSRPVPVLEIHGDTDNVVPYDGGLWRGIEFISAQDKLLAWRDINECSGSMPDEVIDLGDTSRCENFTDCSGGATAGLCTIRGEAAFPHSVYSNLDEIDVAALIWDFLRQQTLTNEPEFQINFGLTGAWFNPETSGQGLLLEVLPTSGQVFVTWFTYADANAGKIGAPEHRWLSGLGTINGGQVVIDLRVTSGGIFDDPTDVERTPVGEYGTLTLDFSDCETATMTYDLFAEGRKGSRSLIRVSAPPQACFDLAQQARSHRR